MSQTIKERDNPAIFWRGSLSEATHNDSVGSGTAAQERALFRKLDLHLLPMMMGLYLFSFLDRVNIGNARLYGLESDLGLRGNQYQVAVSILFVTYSLFEVPSNLVLKKFTPKRYIAAIAIAWGTIATLTGITQSYGGLLACRILLGAFEAGLFPGLVTYLTLFYSRTQLALRIGYLFVSAAIAGAVGGLIAYGIGFMDGTAGLRGWRWILILEGLPAVLAGILAYFVLPNNPETASFFNLDERKMMVMIRERQIGATASAQKFHWADVQEGTKDFQLWIFSLAGFGEDIMLYGFSTFLPTIIRGIGTWTAPQVQALTVPVYAIGAITYLIIAHISDKSQRRGIYAVIFALVSILGYALLLANAGAGVSYAGCFLVAMGLYVSVGLPLAWLPCNIPRYGKRTLATGMQITFGNMAGIAAPFLYPTRDSPRYTMGHAATLALVFMSCCIFAFMTFYYTRVNKNRADGKEDYKVEGMSDCEIDEMGDKSPRYVYSA